MQYIRLIEIFKLQELTLIKHAFNRAGINYKILFENTLQLGESYALGSNGAIVEVVENELEEAQSLLNDLDIIRNFNYNPENDKFLIVHHLEKLTDRIPGLNKISLGLRILLFVAILLILVVGGILISLI